MERLYKHSNYWAAGHQKEFAREMKMKEKRRMEKLLEGFD
jgi:hypothetical protein